MNPVSPLVNPLSRYGSNDSKTPSDYPSMLADEDETVYPGFSPVEVKLKPHQNRLHVSTDSKSLHSEHPFPSETDRDEILENSFIWHIYNEEASKFDTSMVDSSHREIDVLLVFTGLFSAVVSTFIIQVYQMMLPDPADRTNDLLNDLISVQTKLLQSLGTVTDKLEFPLDGPNNQPRPEPSSVQIRLVNNLWFSALACSLLTALISMLAKQWLHSYTRGITGSPRERARIRQNRFLHFRSWHVLTVINCLPLLLHAALFFFLGGIIVLVWKEAIEISIITVTAAAFAYLFYMGSMWISFISPDCPYQHPISSHLHHWLKPGRKQYSSRSNKQIDCGDFDCESTEDLNTRSADVNSGPNCVPTTEDTLDATAFVWLLKGLNNNAHVYTTLQAIVIFPRDFTALHVLRRAGAIQMILKQFQSCFQLDSALGTEWYIKDATAAGKYCQAWMRLSYQTKLRWPPQLIQPLQTLCELTNQPAASVPATCILALTCPEQNGPQIELLSLFSRHLDKQARLSWSMQQDVLDTLLEVIAIWELPAASLAHIVSRAIPILIRLLHELGTTGPVTVRHAINLNLYALTGKFLEGDTRREEAKRKEISCRASIRALSHIVNKHSVVDDELRDIVAVELSRFAKTLITKPQTFPQSLHDSVKDAFTSLYLENRLTAKDVSEDTLADVLYLLHPVVLPNTEHHAKFTLDLVDTLKHHRHPIITRNALRLLECILSSYSLSSVNAFMDGGGLNVLLQISNTGNIDGRQLQMDSLRVLCIFVNISATLYFEDEQDFSASFFDSIFRSDFLKTLCSVVAAGKWWLADVAHLWAPTLHMLCRVRSDDPSWQNVERRFWKYADLHQTANGYPVLIENLNWIRKLRRGLDRGTGKSFFEDF